jgi:hypothetical protein
MSRKHPPEPPTELIEAMTEPAINPVVEVVELPIEAIESPPEPPIEIIPEPIPEPEPIAISSSTACAKCGYEPRHDAEGNRICPALDDNCPSIV